MFDAKLFSVAKMESQVLMLRPNGTSPDAEQDAFLRDYRGQTEEALRELDDAELRDQFGSGTTLMVVKDVQGKDILNPAEAQKEWLTVASASCGEVEICFYEENSWEDFSSKNFESNKAISFIGGTGMLLVSSTPLLVVMRKFLLRLRK